MRYSLLVGPKDEKQSIRYWINYAAIDAEGVLRDAQAYIYGAMRTREMRARSSFRLTIGQEYNELPARFLDPIHFLFRDGAGDIIPTDIGSLERLRAYETSGTVPTGRPQAYSLDGTRMYYDFKPADDYPVLFQFYQRPVWLGPGIETNWVTDRYPNILRAACLMGANDIRQETVESRKWKATTDELIARANIENDYELRGARFGSEQWTRPYYV